VPIASSSLCLKEHSSLQTLGLHIRLRDFLELESSSFRERLISLHWVVQAEC